MLNVTQKKLEGIKKLYVFAEKCPIDLSSSTNPLGCSPKVFQVIREEMKNITHYPDPTSNELKKVLSKKFNIPMRKITFGHGSDHLIDLIPRVLLNPGDEVILPEVTFPVFEHAIILSGGIPVFSEMKKDFSINLKDIKNKNTKKTTLIFLCNPNNPTGKVLSKKEILTFLKNVQPVDVIVDEADIEFGGVSVIREANKINNLIVLRTFSKGFGLPGLRIGICFAREELINAIDKIRHPFPLNTFAEKCAITVLQDKKFIAKSKKFMDNQREFLTKELRKRGFRVVDSQANNILVRVDKLFGSSTDFVKLLNKNNVSVVDGANFRGLSNKFIRISPRLAETNKKFLEVIDKLLKVRK